MSAPLELNPFQARAVTTTGHCTILACPGSGKTRVLSTRAGHLISTYAEGRLCAVTFTRDAANELLTRIVETVGSENTRRVSVGTFHSITMAQLRDNYRGGKPPKLLSDGERFTMLRRCWLENAPSLKFDDVLKEIDAAKAKVNPPPFSDVAMQSVLDGYAEMLKSEHAMDFSDLLLEAVRGMQRGDVKPLNIAWLLVDESQDMDEVQMEWILLHGRAGVEVTLVGDDDQSLYSFRYALGYAGLQEVSFALGSLDLTLPVNYRCAPNILAHAAKLIGRNTHRAAKNIQAFKEVPGIVAVQRLPRRIDECDELTKTMREFASEKWAVLGRTNVLLDAVEAALSTSGIPYKRLGGKSVWEYSIGGVFAGLMRSVNDGSWTGVANTLVFCGVDSSWINEHSRSSSGSCVERLEFALKETHGDQTHQVLSHLCVGFSAWQTQSSKERASLAVEGIAGFLMRYCKPPQAALLEKLRDSFTKIKGSLGWRLALLSRDSKDKPDDAEKVQLMTVHASKGLEFESVWIMGCEEGNLPHTDSTEEDERRLMYVGMTRAKKRLILSSSIEDGFASRFLEEAGL